MPFTLEQQSQVQSSNYGKKSTINTPRVDNGSIRRNKQPTVARFHFPKSEAWADIAKMTFYIWYQGAY
jgi:hypothetical protein